MQTIISDKHKFICVLIYKNATRTLREYFYFSKQYNAKLQNIGNLKKYKDYFIFTFVRNPYDRVLSCYLNKIINPPLHFIEKQLTPFGLKPNMPFNEFVNFLCNDPKGEDHNDPHWTSQHKLIDKGIDFIGRLENFDNDFKTIITHIGTDYKSPKHLNYTTGKGAHYTTDLQYKDKPKNTKSPKVKDYFTHKTAEMIYQRYKEDFSIFKYKKL